MLVVAAALGLTIGLVVGSVGGGGAILALPVLIYVLGEPVGPAASGSLVVVAVAAAVGAGSLAHSGQVCWRIALTFAPPGAAGAVLGTLAAQAVDPALLVLLFVPVMLVAAIVTWQRAGPGFGDDADGCPQPALARVLLAAVAVGLLTGFFGVGGGFVIVPVLALWFGVGFRRAVATSLVIITLTGVVALATHLAAGSDIDVGVTAALALPTALGALLGTRVSARLPAATLGRAFAVVVCAVALFLLLDVLVLGGPPGG
ncbi:MAG: sulfite exporter TauE/SafE family protein [Actinobacteria bacterium]|nr:sulfite exporter TauE/SafE family protein [Actinomycetota bacterium]